MTLVEETGTTGSLSREELYAKVWALPMSKLAKQFGLSDVGLAKICKRHQIPRPPVGYWAKKQWGIEAGQTALSEINDPGLERIDFYYSRIKQEEQQERPLIKDAVLTERIAFEQDFDNTIVVSESCNRYHPLLAGLSNSKPRRSGRQHTEVRHYAAFLKTSPSELKRALLILDALLKAALDRGFEVATNGDRDKGEITLSIEGETFYAGLREPTKRVKKPKESRSLYGQYDYHASGQLELHLGDAANSSTAIRWRDGKQKKIESRLNEVLINCFIGVGHLRKQREESRLREIEYKKKKQLQEEAKRLEWEEHQRIEHLGKLTSMWSKAAEIRVFLHALEERLPSNGEIENEDWTQWLQWAKNYADRLDPLALNTPMLEKTFQYEPVPYNWDFGNGYQPRWPR